MQLNLAGAHRQRRTRVTARGAAVIAEVSDVRRRVLVRRPAADAVLGIGGVLQRRLRAARIVDAEDDCVRPRAREVSDLRIVAVDRKSGGGIEVAHGGAPPLGDVLELAVAVELIAEQVAQAQSPRPQPGRHLGQGSLVDLEEPELRVAHLEQSGGDSRHEVRPRAVVREANARAEDGCGHRSRRGLAVRRRDERRAERQPRGELVDCARIELPEQLAGHRRAAPGAGQARQASGGASGHDLRCKRHGQAHGGTQAIGAGSPLRGNHSSVARKGDVPWRNRP